MISHAKTPRRKASGARPTAESVRARGCAPKCFGSLRLGVKLLSTFAMSFALAAQPSTNGASLFTAHCAGCHGDDGSGGGHGPAIVGPTHQRPPREVIVNGVPGSAMPAFPSLPRGE